MHSIRVVFFQLFTPSVTSCTLTWHLFFKLTSDVSVALSIQKNAPNSTDFTWLDISD